VFCIKKGMVKIPNFLQNKTRNNMPLITESDTNNSIYNTTGYLKTSGECNTDSKTGQFYRLLKKNKSLIKCENDASKAQELTKLTQNLKNIKQSLSINRTILTKSLSSALCSSKNESSQNLPNVGDSVFLTSNVRRNTRILKKKTTIGRSTILIHNNLCVSDVIRRASRTKANMTKKQIIKVANEMTMKTNNNIKTVCYNPSEKKSFNQEEVCTEDIYSDLHKQSYYKSLYKSVTNDNNYHRFKKLCSTVDNYFKRTSMDMKNLKIMSD
jgi:hypothetical protein